MRATAIVGAAVSTGVALHRVTAARRRRKMQDISPQTPTPEEIEAAVAEFNPAPLCSHIHVEPHAFDVVVQRREPRVSTVMLRDEQLEAVDLATYDFLGLARDEAVKTAAKETLAKYGPGACGPRGFYGTLDIFQHLEVRLAALLGCESAILYSYALAIIPSVVATLVKPGEPLVVAHNASPEVQVAARLAKAAPVRFDGVTAEGLDAALRAHPGAWVVVEAVNVATGECAPVDAIVKAAHRHGSRVVLDATMTLSAYAHELPPSDIIAFGIGAGLGGMGGVCAGPKALVEVQRLSSTGYVFTAAAPPPCIGATLKGLDILTPARVGRVRDLVAFLVREVAARPLLALCHEPRDSPIVTIAVTSEKNADALCCDLVRHGFLALPVRGGAHTCLQAVVGSNLEESDLKGFLDALVASA
eukprot:gnl/Chilomastix_cuspidata/7151.p1 GENE.gnl/Chilomastix_cuspidata/7151~~gnl/Chilomastix_cuspidata/7151.p1  ORF type:complete len:417 (-),score=168.80 gnl/Chilomastix_cuspidata/7151:43-1293(-)